MTDRSRYAVLVPAVLVGAAAVAATAHGGYEVALASQVPAGIAWLYPVITDGLALVAYAATRRLLRAGLAYAWAVVIAAAGLSGLAQAVYLASGPALDTSAALRFGVGAWPAVAGAVAAHLVYLIASHPPVEHTKTGGGRPAGEDVGDSARAGSGARCVESPATPPLSPVGADVPSSVPTGLPTPVGLHLAPAPTVAELVAAGAGRKTIARTLDVSEHEARRLLDEHRAQA